MSKLIIGQGLRQRKSEKGLAVLGVDLNDAREEVFVRLVCDGLALGVAFVRAGFKSGNQNAASNLFHLPRIQARAQAVLEARRTSGVVTLGEVTDMLKRVFAGAHSEGEYSAAHNAAFSLARLYGHVTDRASIEVIRRPSRDPDAPSEQALAGWVEALPALASPEGSGPEGSGQASFLRVADAPAPPLGPDREIPNEINGLDREGSSPQGPGPEFPNEIKWLGSIACDMIAPAGRPENGAPSGPVTGTPDGGAHSAPLGPGGPGPTPIKKTGLIGDEGTRYPKWEDLF